MRARGKANCSTITRARARTVPRPRLCGRLCEVVAVACSEAAVSVVAPSELACFDAVLDAVAGCFGGAAAAAVEDGAAAFFPPSSLVDFGPV